MKFRVAVAPVDDTDYESGKTKTRDGLPVRVLQVTAMFAGEAEVWRVRTTSDVGALSQDDAVELRGLTALAWQMDGRSGLAYAAEAVVPIGAKPTGAK
jgi:hypothetical protein